MSLGLKVLMYTVRFLLFVFIIFLIYYIYKESGFFTTSSITLICVELWGKRQIEKKIISFKNKKTINKTYKNGKI